MNLSEMNFLEYFLHQPLIHIICQYLPYADHLKVTNLPTDLSPHLSVVLNENTRIAFLIDDEIYGYSHKFTYDKMERLDHQYGYFLIRLDLKYRTICKHTITHVNPNWKIRRISWDFYYDKEIEFYEGFDRIIDLKFPKISSFVNETYGLLTQDNWFTIIKS